MTDVLSSHTAQQEVKKNELSHTTHEHLNAITATNQYCITLDLNGLEILRD